MIDKAKQFLNYLISKKSELADLEAKDALLAKVILDIHRKRSHSSFVTVALFSVKPIHAIDHDNAIQDTAKRIQALQQKKNVLLEKKVLTKELLAEVLPSISAIKVVKQSENNYIAYEGNGRLAALHKTFTESDGLMIEVEEYHFRNSAKILRRMGRVRRLNGLS